MHNLFNIPPKSKVLPSFLSEELDSGKAFFALKRFVCLFRAGHFRMWKEGREAGKRVGLKIIDTFGFVTVNSAGAQNSCLWLAGGYSSSKSLFKKLRINFFFFPLSLISILLDFSELSEGGNLILFLKARSRKVCL
jgi:hypothetical protein